MKFICGFVFEPQIGLLSCKSMVVVILDDILAQKLCQYFLEYQTEINIDTK